MEIKKQVGNLKDELISLRRDFHKHPELGFEEWRTSEIVSDYLESLGLEVKRGIAKTGVVGLLRGKKAGRTILLRADMDALPIQEENEIPYKSINEGKMHACGHDGHVAMLLVAANVLSQHKDEINGNVKFLFQPCEEIAGAKFMVEEGVLENPHVDAALGLHLWTQLESGKFGITAGPTMAAMDNFKLTIEGQGGHTGSPESAVDPIIAAANVITAVQIIQTREIDAMKPMLIMFGRIEGGTAPNIIPRKVELEGSIRYLYEGGEENEKRFERIVDGICKACRTKYELEFMCSNRLLSNDPGMAKFVRTVAEKLVSSQDDIVSDIITMGGDDFSEFALRVPGTFYFVGAGNKEKETDYHHHHPRFNIDEDTLPTGAEMHVRTALAYLSSESSY